MSAMPFQETLSLKREFSAPVQRVFEAWTNAEVLAQWFGPEGFSVVRSEIDLKVGGQYHITLQAPDDTEIEHWGEYIKVSVPTQLIFTWVLKNQHCQGSQGQDANTLVDIRFIDMGERCAIHLVHEKLPDQSAFDGHQFGWQSSFDSLAATLEND